MERWYFFVSILVLVAFFAGCAPTANAGLQEVKALDSIPSADCPLTVPGTLSFEAPAPFPPTAPFQSHFWFGSENLWTALPDDGSWSDLPHNPNGYTQKIFWWSALYSLKDELEPDLAVTGKRLDGEAPPLNVSK